MTSTESRIGVAIPLRTLASARAGQMSMMTIPITIPSKVAASRQPTVAHSSSPGTKMKNPASAPAKPEATNPKQPTERHR